MAARAGESGARAVLRGAASASCRWARRARAAGRILIGSAALKSVTLSHHHHTISEGGHCAGRQISYVCSATVCSAQYAFGYNWLCRRRCSGPCSAVPAQRIAATHPRPAPAPSRQSPSAMKQPGPGQVSERKYEYTIARAAKNVMMGKPVMHHGIVGLS